jgi:gas vesicle protein
MSRSLQWKLIAGFLLVFIAGATTGAFFGASHARHMFFQPRHGMIGEHMRDRLRKELSLTPEQMAKISPIIDKTATQLEQVRQETGQRVHGIMDNAHREIAANLNDEQRAKLKDMQTRFRHRHERQRGTHRWHSSDSGMSE